MTPAEQKSYVLEHVDYYLKSAPSVVLVPVIMEDYTDHRGETRQREAASEISYSARVEQVGKVEIAIPGSTTFTVLNTKEALTEFRKRALKLPASDRSTNRCLTNPAGKPAKRRVTGFAGASFTDGYVPINAPLKIPASDEREWGEYGEWTLPRGAAIKAPHSGAKPSKNSDNFPGALSRLRKEGTDVLTMTTVYESPDGNTWDEAFVVCESSDRSGTYKAGYLDYVTTAYPNVQWVINTDGLLLGLEGGVLVGIVARWSESYIDRVIKRRSENE